MQSSPQVLAICVNWNGGDLLRETLAALDQSDYPALRVLVVDSASTDQSTDCLPEGVQLLSLSENLGYAAALNRALRHAEEESAAPPSYYLLLNNDIRLFPDCVNRLVAAAEHSKPCICGPRILQWNLPDRLEASWGEIRWNHVLAHFRHQNSTDDLSDTAPSEVELLLGCALLVHRDVVAQVGPWDENFFLYHEEIDYLFRAAKRGIPAIFVPAAGAYHWGGWGTPDALRKVFWDSPQHRVLPAQTPRYAWAVGPFHRLLAGFSCLEPGYFTLASGSGHLQRSPRRVPDGVTQCVSLR